jgi:hypothetical protein
MNRRGVVSTYQVWLRFELFRGTVNQDGFNASQRSLAGISSTATRTALSPRSIVRGRTPRASSPFSKHQT